MSLEQDRQVSARAQRLEDFSGQLRARATVAEVLLLQHLKPLLGRRLRFQKQLALRYIADFYVPSAKVAVEVDGGYHGKGGQLTRDDRRDIFLFGKRNIIVLRFTNEEIYADPAGVASAIAQLCGNRIAERGLGPGFSHKKHGHLVACIRDGHCPRRLKCRCGHFAVCHRKWRNACTVAQCSCDAVLLTDRTAERIAALLPQLNLDPALVAVWRKRFLSPACAPEHGDGSAPIGTLTGATEMGLPSPSGEGADLP